MTDEELLAPLLPADAVFPDDDEHDRLEPLVVALEIKILDGVATGAEKAEYAVLKEQLSATQRRTALWAAARAFALAAVGLSACSPVDVYPCDRDVLELPAEAPPMQVVQCIEGTCDPIAWWTTGDVLVVPCDGGEVWVWW